MTIELPTGVTVRVEFPQMPQVCPAPEAPQPGGVTVPVQGGLTAEQFAHIVAAVTAKVVEELGGQPGGGAGIDDTTIGTDTTWSSQKTTNELAGKADDKFLIMDAESGDLQETEDTLAVGVAKGLMYLPYYLAAFSEFADSTGITISASLPEFTEPGQLYAVRDPETGIVTWHIPSIPV
ncbi:hypothetical protein GS982_02265 [Rhodococcus hoagii]|uniref:Uncharacterized protein n=1 Tax=Rhodococcus hoagii TaxID=43767 RepID=A0A9Q2PQ02_RHOHA|nr:hypothetical protein [Prescottella equi]MBP0080122.1 hypothetical protein [Prescottella equi]NKT71804.1 hypothetical protein [Prescottella equi]NKU24525.1 hypothetical protein [Prescottella equi]NKU76710.1 hypothetical protein [Prescottella equi]